MATRQTRRQVMSGALALGASNLSGCALVGPLNAFCPDDPRISNPTTPLTIDVHGHVFNGTDIPIAPYIKYVRGREDPSLADLGDILQDVNWAFAPSGAEEIAALQEISQALRASCGRNTFESIHVAHRETQYQQGVKELNRALTQFEYSRQQRGLRATRSSNAVANAIRTLPQSYLGHRSQRRRAMQKSLSENTIDAAVEFAVRQFQYRYVNVFDFLTQYSSGSSRKIDLVICHFLDFDWPLGSGNPTRTPIAQQIDVMEQITILTGGRVHCYVPFDPMKQVAHSLGLTFESPLALVQKAILSQGFIGVKMYPPMGFGPADNASKPNSFWSRKWLPNSLKHVDHLGARLDGALSELYTWCIANDVPIMAHTSASEGPADDFQNLTDAKYWYHVPTGLRVNFGHFGNTEVASTRNGLKRAEAYCALMRGPGTHGEKFYADAAYLTEGLTKPSDLISALRTLFRETSGKGPAALAQRLMYGSDWEMLIIAGAANTGYLADFEQIFSQLDSDPTLGAKGKLSDRFFGINAVNYLSLRPGSATRTRLDAFYLTHGIRPPQWAHKISTRTV